MKLNTRGWRSHLFWIKAMTWEYVFPMMLSPFTFTIRSPAQNEGMKLTNPLFTTTSSSFCFCTVQ